MLAKDNPFSLHRIQSLPYRPQGWRWDDLMARLETLRYSASVVGAEGSGKTIFLAELAVRLRNAGFPVRTYRIPYPSRILPRGLLTASLRGVDPEHIIVLDEADRLLPLSWYRLRFRCRMARGLVVTSHRKGLLPCLVECITSVELLHDLLWELVPEDAESLRSMAEQLFTKYRGNIRRVLMALYDRYAELRQ